MQQFKDRILNPGALVLEPVFVIVLYLISSNVYCTWRYVTVKSKAFVWSAGVSDIAAIFCHTWTQLCLLGYINF